MWNRVPIFVGCRVAGPGVPGIMECRNPFDNIYRPGRVWYDGMAQRRGGRRVKDLGRTALAVLIVLLCLTSTAGLFGCAALKAKPGDRAASGRKTADSTALAAGDAALARGDRAEAGRQYLAALKAGADTATVRTRLGDLLLAGAPAKARGEYEKAIKANDKYAPAWQGLGFALYLGGNQAEAVGALERALERDPALTRAAALLGVIENRQGHPEAALAVMEKTLAVAFDPDLENNRGLSLLLLNRPGEAAASFHKALGAKKSAKFTNNLGLALCRLRRYDEAYATFASAGSESAALNNLGVCFMEAGDKPRAQQYFERAITANPTYYAKAQSNLRRLSAMEEVALPSPPPAPTPPPPPSARPLPDSPGKTAPPPPVPAPVRSPTPVSPTPVVQAPPPVSQPVPFVVSPRKPSETERADRAERP